MRLAAAVVALLMVLPISDGSARKSGNGRKKGKVVRVERGQHTRIREPKWCQIRPDGSATCTGKAPAIGEMGSVVDETGEKATVRVTTVTPTMDACNNVVSNEITTETVSGDVSMSNYAWAALFDYRATTSTHIVYNNGQIAIPGNRGPGVEQIWTAFDNTQDEIPELIITYFYCDGSGQVAPQGSPGWCIAYYNSDGGSYTEQRVDIIRQC